MEMSDISEELHNPNEHYTPDSLTVEICTAIAENTEHISMCRDNQVLVLIGPIGDIKQKFIVTVEETNDVDKVFGYSDLD